MWSTMIWSISREDGMVLDAPLTLAPSKLLFIDDELPQCTGNKIRTAITKAAFTTYSLRRHLSLVCGFGVAPFRGPDGGKEELAAQ